MCFKWYCDHTIPLNFISPKIQRNIFSKSQFSKCSVAGILCCYDNKFENLSCRFRDQNLFPQKSYNSVEFLFKISSVSVMFFSSPEPSGSQGELIVYPYSGVRCRCRHRRRRQQCLNIFSSETALPIKTKFYVEPPWEGGTKVYINGPGHMTKMATMPIYGKNL